MVELCGLWRMIRSNGKHLLRCAQICHTNTLFFLGFLLSFRQSTFFHLPSFSARLLSRCFAIALSDSRLPSLSKLHLANILFLFFFFLLFPQHLSIKKSVTWCMSGMQDNCAFANAQFQFFKDKPEQIDTPQKTEQLQQQQKRRLFSLPQSTVPFSKLGFSYPLSVFFSCS